MESTKESEEETPSFSRSTVNFIKLYWRMIFLVAWPLCLIWILFGPWNEGALYFDKSNKISGEKEPKRFETKYMFRTLYVIVVMCGYWLTSCIPIHVTGMIPLFALPLLNVLSSNDTSKEYLGTVNMTLMQSVFLIWAVEFSKLHIRIAYKLIICMGAEPRKLLLGIMIVVFVISMWLWNTACTLLMCPVIKVVIETFESIGIGSVYEPQTEEEKEAGEDLRPTKMTKAYYLGMAYASSLGGLAAIGGTASTLVYKNILETKFPKAPKETLNLLLWSAYGIPVMFILNILGWLILQVTLMGMFRKTSNEKQLITEAKMQKGAVHDIVKKRLKEIGSISWHELWVVIIIIFAIILLVSRQPGVFSGWSDGLVLYGPSDYKYNKNFTREAVIISMSLLLLLILPNTPEFLYSFSKDASKRPTKRAIGLITWKEIQRKTPWSLLFLMGGGACLSVAETKTCLANMIAQSLGDLHQTNAHLIMITTTLIIGCATQFMPNMVAVGLLMPILNELSVSARIHPCFLGHPAAYAASFAFMLPASTPPNIIVAEYANLKVKDFWKVGSLLFLTSYVILIITFVTYGRLIWGALDYPAWAG